MTSLPLVSNPNSLNPSWSPGETQVTTYKSHTKLLRAQLKACQELKEAPKFQDDPVTGTSYMSVTRDHNDLLKCPHVQLPVPMKTVAGSRPSTSVLQDMMRSRTAAARLV